MRYRLIRAITVATLLAPVVAAVQPTREQVLARKFVDAVNTDDATARGKLLTEIYAPSSLETIGIDRIAGQAAGIRERFGLLDLHHGEFFRFDTGNGIRLTLHVFAQGKDKAKWFDFQFRTDNGAAPLVTQLIFVAEVTEPVALPNGDIRSKPTLDWLNAYVDRLAREDQFSGSILIASGDDVIFDRTVGVSDAAGEIANTTETRFGMASGGKMFTAIAIAKLVEQGKIAWDTLLLDAVDGFPDSPRAGKVTLRHLLTHTSGIGEYWTDDYEKHWHELKTLRDTLPFVIQADFVAEPGEEFRYSNSNFILLGLAIEKSTGRSYYDFVKKTIFDPLGMKSTGYPDRDSKSANLAQPLIPADDGWKVANLPLHGTSAGGSVSTTRDMLRFARALVSGKLVKAETLKLMTTSKTAGMSDALDYGFGFIVNRHESGSSFGHGGIANGTDFDLEIFPDKDLTFIIFANRGAPAFDTLKRNAIKLITGER